MVGVLLVGIGLIFLRFDLTIRAPGIVNAVSEMRVFAPMDGAVSELTIQLGQAVTNGELMFRPQGRHLSASRRCRRPSGSVR